MADADSLHVQLEGFEGPLDLLLDLARKQKVDLARVSVLALAEQYLAIIEGARRIRLELAADWLVMAAWLAWLKSRLLVPVDAAEQEEGELAAETLAERLRALEVMRAAAAWLGARPQLGTEVFARGRPEQHEEVDRSVLRLDLPSLLRAYTASARRAAASRTYAPGRRRLWTVQDALERLARLLGTARDWTSLDVFLPQAAPGLAQRAAVASTLLAGLEMAREGRVKLRQDVPFGPVLVRAAMEGAAP